MTLFYDCEYMKPPPYSRIRLIGLINTEIGITVALENNQLVKLGSIGAHTLYNFNIFTVTAKAVLI